LVAGDIVRASHGGKRPRGVTEEPSVSTQEAEREIESNESSSPQASHSEGSPSGSSPTEDSSSEASPKDDTTAESPNETVTPDEQNDVPAESPAPNASPAAPASAAKPSASEGQAASAPSTTKSDATSAGQRIAAQRAAKAAKKAADKARRVEDAAAARETDDGAIAESRPVASAPDEVELRAAEVSRYMESHSNRLLQGIAAVAVILAVGIGVQFYLGRRDEKAGWALAHAVAATSARIGAAPETPDGQLRFGTEAMRDREALRRFRKVVAEYPSSSAARYARVAIANFLISEAKYAEAQTELRKAREGLEGDPRLDAAILEANGIAYLGQEKFAEAKQEFERLARVDRPRHVNASDYLLARTAFEHGDRDGAKQKLTALLERLRADDATPEPHVEDQARELLRTIDPSAVPAPAGGGGLDLNSISPEMLQQLLRQQGLGQ